MLLNLRCITEILIHYDETLLNLTIMIRSDFSRSKPSSPGGSVAIDQVTFSQIYDQYAPALLGVITAIVRNEDEAVRLLEITFEQVCSRFEQFQPGRQPLFVWLLSIARSTALEAMKAPKKSDPLLPQFASIGNKPDVAVTDAQNAALSPTNKLINAVLFENCTPEEAVLAIGLPVETARQQLRLTMQQLRTSRTG